jgi:hypothetical protein
MIDWRPDQLGDLFGQLLSAAVDDHTLSAPKKPDTLLNPWHRKVSH